MNKKEEEKRKDEQPKLFRLADEDEEFRYARSAICQSRMEENYTGIVRTKR